MPVRLTATNSDEFLHNHMKLQVIFVIALYHRSGTEKENSIEDPDRKKKSMKNP